MITFWRDPKCTPRKLCTFIVDVMNGGWDGGRRKGRRQGGKEERREGEMSEGKIGRQDG